MSAHPAQPSGGLPPPGTLAGPQHSPCPQGTGKKVIFKSVVVSGTGRGHLEGAPAPSRVLGSSEEIREERRKERRQARHRKEGKMGPGVKSPELRAWRDCRCFTAMREPYEEESLPVD